MKRLFTIGALILGVFIGIGISYFIKKPNKCFIESREKFYYINNQYTEVDYSLKISYS